MILCQNCRRFFVGNFHVYAPQRRDLAATTRKRTYCPHCGHVFNTGETQWGKRLSKDEWLEIILNSMDVLQKNGRNPAELLRQVNEMKDQGLSDRMILALI